MLPGAFSEPARSLPCRYMERVVSMLHVLTASDTARRPLGLLLARARAGTRVPQDDARRRQEDGLAAARPALPAAARHRAARPRRRLLAPSAAPRAAARRQGARESAAQHSLFRDVSRTCPGHVRAHVPQAARDGAAGPAGAAARGAAPHVPRAVQPGTACRAECSPCSQEAPLHPSALEQAPLSDALLSQVRDAVYAELTGDGGDHHPGLLSLARRLGLSLNLLGTPSHQATPNQCRSPVRWRRRRSRTRSGCLCATCRCSRRATRARRCSPPSGRWWSASSTCSPR